MNPYQMTKVSADQITNGMWNYSYGEGVERTVPLLTNTLAHGLLQIAAGFRVGGTLTMILRDMGFITVRRGNLTKLGRLFLFDCFTDSSTRYDAGLPSNTVLDGSAQPQQGKCRSHPPQQGTGGGEGT